MNLVRLVLVLWLTASFGFALGFFACALLAANNTADYPDK